MSSKCCVQLCGFTSVPVPMTLAEIHHFCRQQQQKNKYIRYHKLNITK